jgi:chromosome partitioning protein
MRGRRRGRNRPSPQSPPSVESAPAAAPGGQGAVKLLDASEPEAESPEDLPPDSHEAGDAPEAADTSQPEESSGTDGSVEMGIREEPDPVAKKKPKAATTTPPAVAADSVGESAPTVTATEDSGGADEMQPDPLPPQPAAEAVEDVAAATTGRQPQSASGNPLPRVMAVANQKGGVGKTTTSVNLGAALAELEFRVLVIDLDPQGNATTGLGIDARNFELSMYDVLMRDCSLEDCIEPTSMKHLFVAPATIALAGAEIELVPAFSRELKLKRAIESVIDDFDYVLIDCPPSLGLITVNALAAAGEVLVPIQCEYYALEGLSQLMRNVHLVASNLNPRLDISTIVLTMYDARTKLADQVATEVREHFGAKVCRIVIPRTVRLSEAPSFGQPITAFDPASRGAIAYRELAKEVSGGTS